MKTIYLSFFLFFQVFYCYSQTDQSLMFNNEGVEEMNKQDLSSAIESLVNDQNSDVIQSDQQDFELLLNDVFVLSGTFENGKRAKIWELDVKGKTLLREVFKDG